MPLAEQPSIRLLDQPTPLQRVQGIEKLTGHAPLYVKRDDLMAVGLGGNKLRSLEYWLGAAKAGNADVLIVTGQPVSNQCRLTAAAAAKAGFDCIVLHNAEDSEDARAASFLNRVFGADVRFLGAVDESERRRAAEHLAEQLRSSGRRPYIIGDPAVGALGYVRAMDELFAQADAGKAPLAHIVLAGSMGPTEAGVIYGNAQQRVPAMVHLVSVEYDRVGLDQRVRDIFAAVGALLGRPLPFPTSHVRYHMDFLGAGYAQPTAEAEAAILTFARGEGIVLEHTYTAKTFAAFMNLARTGAFGQRDAACAIHTGGVPSLFGQRHLFRTL